MDSLRYAVLKDIKQYDADFVQELHMTFEDMEEKEQRAYVWLRVTEDSPVSSWEVLLNGIPTSSVDIEVIVTWRSLDISNSDTFYTDSNGLEMQHRRLNFRSDWHLLTEERFSANYYPINSAVAVVDQKKNLQMTVLNDRAQGGSVIEEARVELMQNRRLVKDDNRGVGESLNETDEYGNGITVSATY